MDKLKGYQKDGWEYWDCESVPTRVHGESGRTERYRKGQWEADPNQKHPSLRGLSQSSDFTPVHDESDLQSVMRYADAPDGSEV